MRATTPVVAVAVGCLAALACGCTYLPFVVFSNPTDSPLRVKLELDHPDCPLPTLAFMPSSHAKRRWRSQDTRPVSLAAVQHQTTPCMLSAAIPARTALEAKITDYYAWTRDAEQDLLALGRVTLDGSLGFISVSGQLLASRFQERGIGYFVWVYGES